MAKYVLFDTETTGNQEHDRIIQIGAMVVHSKDKIEVYNELCSTDIAISIEAMEVHNITPDVIENQPPYSELSFVKRLEELNQKENYLIAHNINFDLEMVKKEGFINQYTLIDTLRCAKHLLPESPYHRLQYLRYALKLYIEEGVEAAKQNITIKAHDAIGDVLVMKLLLSKLILLAKEQFPEDKNPMQTLAKLTQKPVLMKTFRFGKYKGIAVVEIVEKDKGYLKWMQNNLDLDEDLSFTLKYYLG